RVIGASKIARDITERKRMDAMMRDSEDRLRALVAELRQADERKDEFIALLAHELRNPISAIAVASDLLARSSIEDRRGRFAVPAIARQVNQLRCLVDDLLNMARISAGKLVLRKQPLDLLEAVSRIIADRHAIGANGAEIDVSGVPTWVEADSARLQQMIENLLDNAIKYGGTRIGMRVARRPRQGQHVRRRLAARDAPGGARQARRPDQRREASRAGGRGRRRFARMPEAAPRDRRPRRLAHRQRHDGPRRYRPLPPRL